MTPAVIVSLLALAFSVAAQCLWLIVWGARLTQRVVTLEKEVDPLKVLPVQITRIETRQDTWIEQLKDLNASIRWMREPADYPAVNPHKGGSK